MDETESEKENRPTGGEGRVPVIHADDLFRGARQAVIVHKGDRYVLRITRQDKLILNK